MKPLLTLLSLAIVILAALLVQQVRKRRDAEALLNLKSVAASDAANRASESERPHVSRDSLAALDAVVETNRRSHANFDLAASGSESASAAKLASLKDVLVRLPEQSIPELQFATDGDWFSAVDGPLETTEDYRFALGKLRAAAEKRFAGMLQPALRAYLDANGDEFPKEVSQLMPFFAVPIDPLVLRRYKIVPASEVRNVRVGGAWAITQQSLIDSAYDSHAVIGPRGYGAFSTR